MTSRVVEVEALDGAVGPSPFHGAGGPPMLLHDAIDVLDEYDVVVAVLCKDMGLATPEEQAAHVNGLHGRGNERVKVVFRGFVRWHNGTFGW